MAAELTTEQRTRLIQLVRQHPVLYDLRHAEYSNRDVKRELWEQIAEQLKVPGEYGMERGCTWFRTVQGRSVQSGDVSTVRYCTGEASAVRSALPWINLTTFTNTLSLSGVNADVAATKWKNAKDNYDRIRKKVKARSSSGRVHPSRWVHYDQMRFLDHDDRPAARSRRLKAVTAHATLPSTQAAEQESFTDEPEEVKMETFELEEDNLCAHAASTNEKEAVLQQCHTGIQVRSVAINGSIAIKLRL